MTSTVSTDTLFRSPKNPQIDRVKHQHLLDRLNHRLAVAIERGDRTLVAQLTTELSDLKSQLH